MAIYLVRARRDAGEKNCNELNGVIVDQPDFNSAINAAKVAAANLKDGTQIGAGWDALLLPGIQPFPIWIQGQVLTATEVPRGK